MKTIRKSTLADIPEMLRIYSRAKAAMRASGNNSQWTGPYPGAEAAEADIARGWSHIVEVDGHAAGTFCLMDAPEPTYSGGDCTWLSDTPYLTLHRVASDGTTGGILAAAVGFAAERGLDIRLDTPPPKPPRNTTISPSTAASDVYKGQINLSPHIVCPVHRNLS